MNLGLMYLNMISDLLVFHGVRSSISMLNFIFFYIYKRNEVGMLDMEFLVNWVLSI